MDCKKALRVRRTTDRELSRKLIRGCSGATSHEGVVRAAKELPREYGRTINHKGMVRAVEELGDDKLHAPQEKGVWGVARAEEPRTMGAGRLISHVCHGRRGMGDDAEEP